MKYRQWTSLVDFHRKFWKSPVYPLDYFYDWGQQHPTFLSIGLQTNSIWYLIPALSTKTRFATCSKPFGFRETRSTKMCVFQRAFVSDAEDNVVKELSSTEQRCLLHFGFEVDREPEDFYWETSGWQDFAGFRRGQTWPWNLSSSVITIFATNASFCA